MSAQGTNERKKISMKFIVVWFFTLLVALATLATTNQMLQNFLATFPDRETPLLVQGKPQNRTPSDGINGTTTTTPLPSTRVSMSDKLQKQIDELLHFSSRFYMYTDRNITQEKPARLAPVYYRRYGKETEYEEAVRTLLRNHSLRTDDPDQADLFIVPTPIGKILTHKGLSYDEAFNALTSHPVFQKHGGNKHVIISMPLVTYSFEHKGIMRPLSNWYAPLQNVTAALAYDPIACQQAYQRGDAAGNDYEKVFRLFKPVVHHAFSTALGEPSPELAYHKATVQKFNRSKYFIFYHTRTSPSMYNATRFRHAPIYNVSQDALPLSSIGFDTSKKAWLERYPDSKFCLVIRGDNPQTHAFIRSIKVGCIPVVISDWFPIYSPALKSTLDMKDYCIFIDEDKFIADPQGELLKLQDLSMEAIKEKIEALAFAQRVLLTDHPESLYVPAFLKEAQNAMKYRAETF